MISKNGYRYEVTNKIIFAWLDTQAQDEPPCLLQDLDPLTSQPFASDAEATAWIEEFIIEATKPREEKPPAEVVTE